MIQGGVSDAKSTKCLPTWWAQGRKIDLEFLSVLLQDIQWIAKTNFDNSCVETLPFTRSLGGSHVVLPKTEPVLLGISGNSDITSTLKWILTVQRLSTSELHRSLTPKTIRCTLHTHPWGGTRRYFRGWDEGPNRWSSGWTNSPIWSSRRVAIILSPHTTLPLPRILLNDPHDLMSLGPRSDQNYRYALSKSLNGLNPLNFIPWFHWTWQ